MRFVRQNALSLVCLGLFAGAVGGQSIAGHRAFNEEELVHDGEAISYGRYLVSSDFGQAVLENWRSEWLQFAVFALATVWFIQKGSNESKEPGQEGLESDEQQKLGAHAPKNAPRWAKAGGWRRRIYSHSLVLVMAALFFGSWLGQSVTAWNSYNDDQLEHDQPAVSWATYLASPDFWEKSLQNWQSEFLAIGTMAVFTIYLRERGSPESKPVGAPHHETASSG